MIKNDERFHITNEYRNRIGVQMKKFILFLPLLIAACATNKLLYNDENGNPVYQATCGGTYLTYGDCLAKMGEICPRGFNILFAKENRIGSVSGFDMYGNNQSNTYASGSAYGLGNSIYANGRANTYGSFAANGNGYALDSFERYVIYSCK